LLLDFTNPGYSISGNPAKLTSLPQFQSSGIKRKIVTTSSVAPSDISHHPLDNRSGGTVKIVRVNPSISIQPKKATAATLVTSSSASSTIKPGFTVKMTQAPSAVTKTVVVTSSGASLSAAASKELLRKQFEEKQRAIERSKEQLRLQELEYENMRKMFESQD
jgi:Ulp1 family protease